MLCALVGCTTLSRDAYDERFGTPDPKRFDTPALPATAELSHHEQIQPILSRRCVVCHGCYDASCQLKLGAWEGVARGSSKLPVYDAERLREAPPTRLFVDAQLPSQWRAKGFDAVLNERRDTPVDNLSGSVLYQSLALKQQHPLLAQPVLGEAFDFSIDRDNACPRIDQFADHAARNPLAGMPYGLPGLSADEQAKLTRWLAAGSPYEGDVPLSTLQSEQVRQWEVFLNGPSLKERLMSRYLYEHLFLGHLHFDADPAHRSFRIVRSASPMGQPVQIIATRRPYDDPGTSNFYYRLEPEREVILAKTHMPYALNPARMDKYRRWFLVPGAAAGGRCAAVVRRGGGIEPVRGLPRPVARWSLPLPAR
ncbi:MAG: fatty acid cis/trans isomerase [Rubrivivax sp.]